MFLFSSILISLISAAVANAASANDENIYRVRPENAHLEIERTDLAPVVKRSLRPRQKDRGLFGAGWCSNLDLKLIASDESPPLKLEIQDCAAGQNRYFRKVGEVWTEETSSTRVLRQTDGKWQMTDAEHATFLADGSLESFVGENDVRWFVRRDSSLRITGLDNLKLKPLRFRYNGAGDLDAIFDQRGRIVAKYRFQTVLQSAELNGTTEVYEYDAEGGLLKLVRNRVGSPSQLWRFLYTNPEQVSSVQEPSGCTARWQFDRSTLPPIAKESRSCVENRLGTAKPVQAQGPIMAPTKEAVAGKPVSDSKVATTAVTLVRAGDLGVGSEKAIVTVDRVGMPVLFEILGSNGQVRRLEITREAVSGSALILRSGGVEVNLRNKPRAYSPQQLNLLDDYENWMSSWGSR